MYYDLNKILDSLTIEDVFQLLSDFGGEPRYIDTGILSRTICHNPPGFGSHKLYYYTANKMFYCYSEDGSMSIFSLIQKVMKIQYNQEYEFYDCLRWLANYIGVSADEDIEIIQNHLNDFDKREIIEYKESTVELSEYNNSVLNNFKYNIKITPWIEEGITREEMAKYCIGYYPGGEQITIPHFDIDNRLVGIRGRSLVADEAEIFGKYRPLKVGSTWYNHALGLNLYGINITKDNIKKAKTAIIYESEKSCLKHGSKFGDENNISVACCGSNISSRQIKILRSIGVNNIIIAFDRQYKEIGDNEFKLWTKKLSSINNKFRNEMNISFMFDKKDVLKYKNSPIDQTIEDFEYLLKNMVRGDDLN